MRLAKTLALTAVAAVALLAPAAKADCVCAVDKILGHVPAMSTTKVDTVIVTPVVVETTSVLPLTITTTRLFPDDDMTIRSRELREKISDRLADGSITSSEADNLKTAMAHVDNAEAAFRSDGRVSFKEGKTLYRAMDRVGSDLDFYVEDPSIFGLPLRTEHVLRNWSI